MNPQEEWASVKERILLRWPNLGEKDIDWTAGDRDALLAILELKLGYAHANAVSDLDMILGGKVVVPEVADETHHTGTSGPVDADGQPVQASASGSSPGFAGYPEHYLLGIIDDRKRADAAVRALADRGTGGVQVFRGERGANRLDSKGNEHGLFASLLRTVEYMSAEIDHLGEYEQAVREGASVLAVYAGDENVRLKATAVLTRHNARFVNYFGALVVELVAR